MSNFAFTPKGWDVQGAFPVDFRIVKSTIAERDAITPATRYQGLTVTVLDDGNGTQKTYQLVGGIDNSDWSDFGSGGIGIDPADASLNDTIIFDGADWVPSQAPIVYPNLNDETVAWSNDLLELLQIDAEVNINHGVFTGHSLVVGQEVSEDPFAVFNGGSVPGFEVRADNTIFGANAALDTPRKLFSNDTLSVDKWLTAADVGIDLSSPDTKFEGFDGIEFSTVVDMGVTSGFEVISINSLVDDTHLPTSVSSLQSTFTIKPNVGFVTEDYTDTVFNGLYVDPTINETLIADFNAIRASYGDFKLDDGVIVIGDKDNVANKAYINIEHDPTALDYVMRNRRTTGAVTSHIKTDGDAYFLGDLSSESYSGKTSKAHIVHNLECVQGSNVTQLFGNVGTMNVGETWLIDYNVQGTQHSGKAFVSAETSGATIIHQLNPGVTTNTPGVEFKGVRDGSGNVTVYTGFELGYPINSIIRLSVSVLGSSTPSTGSVSMNDTPTGDLVEEVFTQESFWSIDNEGNIYNNNAGNVSLYGEVDFNDLLNIYTVGDNVYLDHTPTGNTSVFVDQDGSVGINTNAIWGTEGVTIGGETGISNLTRVGSSLGSVGQAPIWDTDLARFTNQKIVDSIEVSLSNLGNIVPGGGPSGEDSYIETLPVSSAIGDNLVLKDTINPGSLDNFILTLPTPTIDGTLVDIVVKSSTSGSPIYLYAEGATGINWESTPQLLKLGAVLSMRYTLASDSWVIGASGSVSREVITKAGNFTIDESVKSGSVIHASNAVTIAFPDPSTLGGEFSAIVYNADGSDIIVSRNNGNDILLYGKGDAVELQQYGSDYIIVSTGNAFDAEYALTYAATTIWNNGVSSAANVTLTGDTQLDVTGVQSGDVGILRVIQDATGSHSIELPVNSTSYGKTTVNPLPNAISIFSFYFDGTNFNWTTTTNAGLNYVLGDLVDVNTAGSENNNILKYNSGIWSPGVLSGVEVSFDPTGLEVLTADNTQDALEEIDAALDVLADEILAITVDAANVSYSDTTTGIGTDNVQDTIDDFYDEFRTHSESTNLHTSVSEKANWNDAYGWGDHALEGYLLALSEDPSPQAGGDMEMVNHRFLAAQGDDLTSATNLNLEGTTNQGNAYIVNGTTSIELLSNLQWTNGSYVTLKFTDSLTLKHNQTPITDYSPMILKDDEDMEVIAGDMITFVLMSGEWMLESCISTHSRYAIIFNYSADTVDSDPGNDYMKFDNTDLSSVTWVNFSKVMQGTDIGSLIDDLDDGMTVEAYQADDPSKYIRGVVDGTITVETNYVHIPLKDVVGGVTFDVDAECVTNYDFSASSGGGHIIEGQVDSDAEIAVIQRSKLRFLSKNGESIVSDTDATENATIIEPKIAAQNDFDKTGQNAGDLIGSNATNDGYEPQATAVDENTLHSVEANVSADGQLSTIIPADYSIVGVRVVADGTTTAGTLALGTTALGNEFGELLLTTTINTFLPIKNYNPSQVNDTDMYVSGITAGTVELRFVFEQGVRSLGSMASKEFWSGTQAEYDGLGSYDNNTIYFIEV